MGDGGPALLAGVVLGGTRTGSLEGKVDRGAADAGHVARIGQAGTASGSGKQVCDVAHHVDVHAPECLYVVARPGEHLIEDISRKAETWPAV